MKCSQTERKTTVWSPVTMHWEELAKEKKKKKKSACGIWGADQKKKKNKNWLLDESASHIRKAKSYLKEDKTSITDVEIH